MKVLFWDEAIMNNKAVINVVDNLFRDITNVDEPFGGKIVIFAGDFRQTLPVSKREGRGGIVSNLLIKLPWWKNIQKLKLTQNMRVLRQGNTEEARQFSSFLLQVGNGSLPQDKNGVCRIPDQYVFQDGMEEEFIKWCYPDISSETGPSIKGKRMKKTYTL